MVYPYKLLIFIYQWYPDSSSAPSPEWTAIKFGFQHTRTLTKYVGLYRPESITSMPYFIVRMAHTYIHRFLIGPVPECTNTVGIPIFSDQPYRGGRLRYCNSGCLTLTRVFGGTDCVTNTLPLIVAPRPMTVSPPRILALG